MRLTNESSALVTVVVILLVATASASAQYAIPVQAVVGGGRISTSEGYAVAGTVGHPSAGGSAIGGTYTLVDGFWGAMSGYLPFTDQPLVPGATPILALHIGELRARVDAQRLRGGLPAYSYTDPLPTAFVTIVRTRHVLELRAALAEAYVAAGRPVPAYGDPAPAAGGTIRALHIDQLRAAVIALE
jgi:hypothetical protein